MRTYPEHHVEQNERFLFRLHADRGCWKLVISASYLHHPCSRRQAHLVLLLTGQTLPGGYGRRHQRVREHLQILDVDQD